MALISVGGRSEHGIRNRVISMLRQSWVRSQSRWHTVGRPLSLSATAMSIARTIRKRRLEGTSSDRECAVCRRSSGAGSLRARGHPERNDLGCTASGSVGQWSGQRECQMHGSRVNGRRQRGVDVGCPSVLVSHASWQSHSMGYRDSSAQTVHCVTGRDRLSRRSLPVLSDSRPAALDSSPRWWSNEGHADRRRLLERSKWHSAADRLCCMPCTSSARPRSRPDAARATRRARRSVLARPRSASCRQPGDKALSIPNAVPPSPSSKFQTSAPRSSHERRRPALGGEINPT
jgi:hypothetical protein